MKLIIANWKMNPNTSSEATNLAKEVISHIPENLPASVVFAPPFIFLDEVKSIIDEHKEKHISLGAQDASIDKQGPETGEVSPDMLKDSGVEYVILGHSERRALFNESDELIAKKVKASLEAGLKVILCVGEPLEVRNRGFDESKELIKTQLEKSLPSVPTIYPPQATNLIIAYEPIWSISTSGTGKTETPESASEMISFVKEFCVSSLKFPVSSLRVLYGGSVNAKNAESFLKQQSIDGLLVGGASLHAKEFGQIIVSASNF